MCHKLSTRKQENEMDTTKQQDIRNKELTKKALMPNNRYW